MGTTRGPGAVGIVAVAAIATVGAVLLTVGQSGVRTDATVSTIEAAPLVSTTIPPTTTTLADALGVAAGSWTALPEAPVRPRPAHTGVWTGEKLVVWGGGSTATTMRADGAAYDVATGGWRELQPAPAQLGERMWHTATWSRRRMVVWGGYLADPAAAVPGAEYDPDTDRWFLLGDPGTHERYLHSAVAADREVMLWGGLPADSPAPVGLVVTRETDDGRPIPGVPIVPRSQHTAVWTGDEMIVWGGRSAEEPFPAGGAAFGNIVAGWRLVPAAPIGGRTGHTAVWTGDEMIVWGGARLVAATELGDGAAYDPITDTWRTLPPAPVEPRRNHVAVWTGTEMVVWGGETGVIGFDGARGAVLADGAAYDPISDEWRMLPAAPGRGSADAVAVWAEEAKLMLVWGVDSFGQEVGLAYRP